MRTTDIETQVAQAAADGATATMLGVLARDLAVAHAADAVAKAKAAKVARRRDRGAEGQAQAVRRMMRALTRRIEDDPTGVGEALQVIQAEVDATRDDTVRAMRESRTMGWPAIAEAVGMNVRTCIRRYGPEGLDYPGGLPEGGQLASLR